jgi:hypothetical protein
MRKLIVVPVSLVSTVGLYSFASPAMASSEAIPVTGTISWVPVGKCVTTATICIGPFGFTPQGQQCLITVHQRLTYSGGLEGYSDTVGPVQWRFFAPCDEVLTSGGAGLPNIVSDVEHFVGNDGREATFVAIGKNDGFGHFDGTLALHGDLNGNLKTSEVGQTGLINYEGKVVFRD